MRRPLLLGCCRGSGGRICWPLLLHLVLRTLPRQCLCRCLPQLLFQAAALPAGEAGRRCLHGGGGGAGGRASRLGRWGGSLLRLAGHCRGLARGHLGCRHVPARHRRLGTPPLQAPAPATTAAVAAPAVAPPAALAAFAAHSVPGAAAGARSAAAAAAAAAAMTGAPPVPAPLLALPAAHAAAATAAAAAVLHNGGEPALAGWCCSCRCRCRGWHRCSRGSHSGGCRKQGHRHRKRSRLWWWPARHPGGGCSPDRNKQNDSQSRVSKLPSK